MEIPNQDELNEAIKKLRINALRTRLARAGVDITKLSRQHFDQILNITVKMDTAQEDFNAKSRAIQQEAEQKIQSFVAEANTKIKEDADKYNEIISGYISFNKPIDIAKPGQPIAAEFKDIPEAVPQPADTPQSADDVSHGQSPV
jgi:predicted amino acid-binding ACT domain protein